MGRGRAPGEWTDDTSMALALAESGDDADNKSGNGSIMRLASVAIHYLGLFPGDLDGLASHAASSSKPTHRGADEGLDREEVLSPEWPILADLHRRDPLEPAILAVARGGYRRKEPPQIRGGGYVVDSLEATPWAFHKAPTFRDAVLAAVNLGDDADTTGAVCGQLAGAYFGVDGIPAEWLEGLAKPDWLEDAVRRLGRPEIFPRPSSEAASPSYTTTAAGAVTSARPPPRLAEADATPPTTRCYWVVQGRLLAGAYPGNADPAAHRARIEKL